MIVDFTVVDKEDGFVVSFADFGCDVVDHSFECDVVDSAVDGGFAESDDGNSVESDDIWVSVTGERIHVVNGLELAPVDCVEHVSVCWSPFPVCGSDCVCVGVFVFVEVSVDVIACDGPDIEVFEIVFPVFEGSVGDVFVDVSGDELVVEVMHYDVGPAIDKFCSEVFFAAEVLFCGTFSHVQWSVFPFVVIEIDVVPES